MVWAAKASGALPAASGVLPGSPVVVLPLLLRLPAAFQPPSGRLPAVLRPPSGALPATFWPGFLRPSFLLPFRLPLLLPETLLPASVRRSAPASAPRGQIVVLSRLRASFRRTFRASCYSSGASPAVGAVVFHPSKFFGRLLRGVPALISPASGHFQRRFRPFCAELQA